MGVTCTVFHFGSTRTSDWSVIYRVRDFQLFHVVLLSVNDAKLIIISTYAEDYCTLTTIYFLPLNNVVFFAIGYNSFFMSY